MVVHELIDATVAAGEKGPSRGVVMDLFAFFSGQGIVSQATKNMWQGDGCVE